MSNVETSVEATPEVKIAPRKLSDTWEGWAGEAEENNGDLETSPWYFLSFATIVLLALTGVIWTALFLVEPRLQELPVWLNRSILMSVWGVLSAVNLMFALIVLTVATGKNFVPFMKGRHIALSSIIPWTVKAGKLFGLSKDRISNSVLQVGNRLTVANQGMIQREELLILLPRCLDKQTRDDIKLVTSKYDVDFHICAGGQVARQLLAERRPKGLIAVACERDLMAGVQDVKAAVPVIAIANKRPEGPCRNTHINMNEMENAIRMFLGKELLPETKTLVEQN